MVFYSQDGQDEFVNNIFNGLKYGFFVDVGAHDGIKFNNTLFFENKMDWIGINIEPIKSVYDLLVKNRNRCININCAIDEKDGKSNFILNEGYTEMLSGLEKYYDERHLERLQRELETMSGKSTIVEVSTFRLDTILNMCSVSHINYLSIDVEGAEYGVVKSINFDNVFIDVIGFENNYEDVSENIVLYLKNNGFVIIYKGLDIIMINEKSKYLTSVKDFNRYSN